MYLMLTSQTFLWPFPFSCWHVRLTVMDNIHMRLLGMDRPQIWLGDVSKLSGCVLAGRSVTSRMRSPPEHSTDLISETHQTPNIFALPRHRSSFFFFFFLPLHIYNCSKSWSLLPQNSVDCTGYCTVLLSDMRLGLAALLCFFSSVLLSDCAPPTCYSRALGLSQEIMVLLDKIHTYHLTVSILWPLLSRAILGKAMWPLRISYSNDTVCWVAEVVCWNPTSDLP